jgi:hypothetical protein
MPLALRTPSGPAVLIAVGLALAPVAAGPAAGQGRIPMSTTWEEVPQVVAGGATVVVRTRDGSAMKGRLRSLSDTAIVLDGGKVSTIPAAAIASIEGRRSSRPIRRGANIGNKVGLLLAGLYSAAAADTTCAPEECVTWSDALFGAFFFPAVGTGIGATIGALIPGKRALLYAAPASSAAAFAPIAGHGRRGAAVRVAF